MEKVAVIVRSAVLGGLALALVAPVGAFAAENAAPAPAAKECAPSPTTKLPLGVRVNIPHEQQIGGVVLRVDYPADKVMLPGAGPVDGPGEGVLVLVEGATTATNDLDTGVRVMVAQAGVMTARDLLTITFSGCEGGETADVGDFTCTIEQARDSGGNPVSDATCAVSVRAAADKAAAKPAAH